MDPKKTRNKPTKNQTQKIFLISSQKRSTEAFPDKLEYGDNVI